MIDVRSSISFKPLNQIKNETIERNELFSVKHFDYPPKSFNTETREIIMTIKR